LCSVNGVKNPVASCKTEIADGMTIRTNSAELEEARRMNLLMLAQNYPADAFTAFPDKPFHKLAREYGLIESDFQGTVDPQLSWSTTLIHIFGSICRAASTVIAA
jgi:predicted molibdopterin-dependent oxidoreductase YjgC